MDAMTTWNDEGEGSRQKNRERKDEAHNTVFRMWEEGIRDLHEIEIETGYAVSYIRHLLKKRGYSISASNVKSTAEVLEICHDYTSNMQVKELLRKHKISNNTLYQLLDEQAIPIRKMDSSRNDNKNKVYEAAIQMYQDDYLLKDIIAETGITAAVLYQQLANRGIDIRRKKGGSDEALSRAVDMYKESVSMQDIEIETGVSTARLYKELAAKNVPIRRGNNLEDRLNEAVRLYQLGASGQAIYNQTKVNSTMLYRALRRRGIAKHSRSQREAQGVDVSYAFELYDKGAPFPEIRRAAHIAVEEMVDEIKKRGQNLRTGLPLKVTSEGLDYAVESYKNGVDLGTIEVETLVTNVQLFAELNKRGIALRP